MRALERKTDDHRPKTQPGFRLDRAQVNDRVVNDTLPSYAADDAHGTRYQSNGSGPEPD